MAQPYVGEIRMFAGSFAPAGWMFCDGQTLQIAENDVLFQLIGTTYGGDGEETFDLPNLQSRVPIHQGNGPDGSTYKLAETGGAEAVTLSVQQMPVHTHQLLGSANATTTNQPQNNVAATLLVALQQFPYGQSTPILPIDSSSVQPQGGSQPHDNMQPFLVISFIISLYGIFPSQN
jgi:microcystin-dependent protein